MKYDGEIALTVASDNWFRPAVVDMLSIYERADSFETFDALVRIRVAALAAESDEAEGSETAVSDMWGEKLFVHDDRFEIADLGDDWLTKSIIFAWWAYDVSENMKNDVQAFAAYLEGNIFHSQMNQFSDAEEIENWMEDHYEGEQDPDDYAFEWFEESGEIPLSGIIRDIIHNNARELWESLEDDGYCSYSTNIAWDDDKFIFYEN